MQLVKGLRVVRGPLWKWGEQDGGEGSVGTVVDILKDDSSSSLLPISSQGKKTRIATVVWDNGTKGSFHMGPEGVHDLLILDSAASGVKHKYMPCHSCKVEEILGMRWQCLECSVNFCCSCFYRIKELHNQHYKAFHRYDSPESQPVLINLDKEKKLVNLCGIYEGARVTRGRDWVYGKEDEGRIGEVITSLTHDKVSVRWAHGFICSYRRGAEGKMDLKVVEAAVGGQYDPLWLPIFGSKSSALRKDDKDLEERLCLSVGDLVQVYLDLQEFREKQAEYGGWHPEMCKLVTQIGTIFEIGLRTVTVQFDGSDRKWYLNPAVLKKLSQFSVGQIVRVKDDSVTLKAMQFTLGNKIAYSLSNETGRIVSKSLLNKNEEHIYLELMDLQSKDAPMRPEWLKAVPVSTQLHQKFSQLKSDMVDLFIEAAGKGDFYLVRELVTLYNAPVDAGRKEDGSAALHLACLNGHLDLIQLLLEKKADLEKEDTKGRRAVYFAVKGCQPEVLKLLIRKGAELDPLTKKRKLSPLLKAVTKQYTDCAQILMDNNCDINLQDEDGDTALHKTAFSKMELSEALLQCDRVDLSLKNKKGYSVFHVAVSAGNVPVVQFLLDKQESLALEKVEGSQLSALHLASSKGDLQVVHLLLERFNEKLPVDDVDSKGRTALMMACRRGHYGIIEFLVESGARVNIADCKRDTEISSLLKKLRFHHAAPLPDMSFNIHSIYAKLLEKYGDTMNKFPSLSAVSYLIKKGGKMDINNHQTEDPKVTQILKDFMKDVPTPMDESGERQLFVDERSVCILCASQASSTVFNCCNTTSSLTCAECYFILKNCPHCRKPVESYRRSPQDFSDEEDELDDDLFLNGSIVDTQIHKDVTEEAAPQHSVEHNYLRTTTPPVVEIATPAVANLPRGNISVVSPVMTPIPQQKVIPTIKTLVPVMMPTRSNPLVGQTRPIILRPYPGRKVVGTAGTSVNVLRVIPSLPASSSGALSNSQFEPAGASAPPQRTSTPVQSTVEFAKNLGLAVASDQLPQNSTVTEMAQRTTTTSADHSIESAEESGLELPDNYHVIGKSRKQADLIQDSKGHTYTKRNTGTGVLQCTKKQSDSKNRCTAILFKKDAKWYCKGEHRCTHQRVTSVISLPL